MLKNLAIYCIYGIFFTFFPLAANDYYGPYQCMKVNEDIKIDGRLDERAWCHAKPVKFKGLANGKKPEYDSTAKMIWDNKYFYIGMDFKDPNVWATVKTKDILICGGRKSPGDDEAEIMNTDCFGEIFLDPDADGINYVEFHINPLNSIYDCYFNCGVNIMNKPYPNREYHWEWTCHKISSAINVDGTLNNFTDTDKGWSFEMAIPWHELQLFTKGACPPKSGDIWKTQLGRAYRKGPNQLKQYWTWAVLGMIQCHIPGKWQTIEFVKDKVPENSKSCCIGWMTMEKDVSRIINKAHELGFNILVGPIGLNNYKYINNLCAKANEKGIDVFYRFTILAPKRMKEYSQIINEKEKFTRVRKKSGKRRYQFCSEPVNLEDVHAEEFLCFHRPEVIAYSRGKLKEVLANCPRLGGIAFDFIGYKNHKCCRCPVSMKQFKEYYDRFVKPGNIMSREKALEQFSLDTLIDFNNRLAGYVRKLKPGIKTASHIYPVFTADPVYGNRFDVDYCCQTVTWYFESFGDLKKVDYTEKVLKDDKRYFPRPTGIPSIGICIDKTGMDELLERFKKELKTIRKHNCRSISIYPFNIFLKYPKLGNIVIEKLDN